MQRDINICEDLSVAIWQVQIKIETVSARYIHQT